MNVGDILPWLGLGLALVVLASIKPYTARWSRFMLRAWVFPSGLFWLLTLFIPLTAAATLGIVAALLGFVWSVPRDIVPPTAQRGDFRLVFVYGMPAVVLGCLSLLAPVGRFAVDATALPADRSLFNPSQPLTVCGVALGQKQREVDENWRNLGKAEPLRPLFRFWGITARRYPDGLLVYFDRRGEVVRVDGQDLEQEGRTLAQTGHAQARVEKQFVGNLDHYRNTVCQFGYGLKDRRVTSCSVALPGSGLLELGDQKLAISEVRLEMPRAEVEKLLGKPTGRSGRTGYPLTAYGALQVAYFGDSVVGVMGPKMVDWNGQLPPQNGRYLYPQAYGLDCANLPDGFTGALVTVPSYKDPRQPHSAKLEQALVDAGRAAKY